MSIFYGNKDVDVKIVGEKLFRANILNKALLVTIEEDIPLLKLDGQNVKSELEAYLTANTLTAPLLVDAATKFSGQIDVNGNSVYPEYVYVVGATGIDEAAAVTAVTALIEASVDANDYYFIVPIFDSVAFRTWFATWGNTKERFMLTPTKKAVALTAPELTDRGIGINDDTAQNTISAFAGEVTPLGNTVSWKWRELTGITPDVYTDAEVITQAEAGKNVYRYVRGLGEISGSFALSSTQAIPKRADEIIIKDNVKSVVASAIHTMFKTTQKVPMGIEGTSLVKKTITSALDFLTENGFILIENNVAQYSVTVPKITAAMRANRELTGVKFTYIPSVSMETIEVTGEELLGGVE